MMRISDEALKELQEIWKREFNEEISLDRAKAEGNRLIRLFKILYTADPDEKSRKS